MAPPAEQRIPVVILCGGLGTRLREETEYRPKPMVEIGGRPILWHIMRLYAHHGFKEFILCLGYKGMMIKEYFLNYQPLISDFTIRLGGEAPSVSYLNGREAVDWSVTLADTGLEAMTGARVKRIQKYVYGRRAYAVLCHACIDPSSAPRNHKIPCQSTIRHRHTVVVPSRNTVVVPSRTAVRFRQAGAGHDGHPQDGL